MEYQALKLCAPTMGGIRVITPPPAVVDIDENDEVNRGLIKDGFLGNPQSAPDAPEAALVGELNGDTFAVWLAAGAKVREVTAWIGDSVARAEVAMADTRPGVQKHIDKLLADTPDDVAPEAQEAPADEDSGVEE